MSAVPSLPPPWPKLASARADAAPSPRLEDGARLDAETFMRLYERSPHVKKAELVQGVVHVASPVRARAHGRPDSLLQYWLGVYQEAHPELAVYANATLRLGPDGVLQPDIVLCRETGETVQIDADDYLRGAPDLVCEIAASSAKLDLQPRKASYQEAGVREYLVWRTLENRIDWFTLEAGDYVPLMPDAAGVLWSQAFPGLALDTQAALRLDSPALAATLRRAMGDKAGA